MAWLADEVFDWIANRPRRQLGQHEFRGRRDETKLPPKPTRKRPPSATEGDGAMMDHPEMPEDTEDSLRREAAEQGLRVIKRIDGRYTLIDMATGKVAHDPIPAPEKPSRLSLVEAADFVRLVAYWADPPAYEEYWGLAPKGRT